MEVLGSVPKIEEEIEKLISPDCMKRFYLFEEIPDLTPIEATNQSEIKGAGPEDGYFWK